MHVLEKGGGNANNITYKITIAIICHGLELLNDMQWFGLVWFGFAQLSRVLKYIYNASLLGWFMCNFVCFKFVLFQILVILKWQEKSHQCPPWSLLSEFQCN
jgi:hypothetical protein